jgi:hypothetical protein
MGLKPHPLKPRRDARKREENRSRKKTEKEDKKSFVEPWEEDRTERRRQQFQTGGFTPFSDRR